MACHFDHHADVGQPYIFFMDRNLKSTPVIIWNPSYGAYGFADRLRGLGAALILGESLEAQLVLKWVPNSHCPFDYSQVIAHPKIVTVASEEELGFYRGDYFIDLPLNSMPHESFRYLSQGFPFLIPNDFQTFRARWCHKLDEISPVQQVVSTVDDLWSSLGSKSVFGIHLRRTDNVNSHVRPISDGNLRNYDDALYNEILRLNQKFPNSGFFLACDSQRYSRKWYQNLSDDGVQVVTFNHEWDVSTRRQTSGFAAACDLFALKRCREIVTSTFSSFSYFAGKSAGIRVKEIPPE